MYESVPDELKDLRHWCCFKKIYMPEREKWTKVPYNANNGKLAKSNDETTWADFDTALASSENFDGIGFFFKEPYFGIDLDNVPDEIARYKNGDHEDNIVSEFIEMMGSYTEYSPSGNGIHIICKGELPKGGRRKGDVEMYDSGRFFTVTGNSASDYRFIVEDDYGRIGYLHNKYIARPESKTEIKHSHPEAAGNNLSESEIIRIAEASKNGMRFKLFINGGWEQFYSSQSEADMAFANDLAFWTAMDFSKMDSIFRGSSLMRDKWDSKRDKSTYGVDTLNKAIRECSNVFKPSNPEDDFNLYVLDQDAKKVERKHFSYDDTGNAERFVQRYRDNTRYSYTNKCWYFYDGKQWVTDTTGQIKRLLDAVVEEMKNEDVYVADGMDEEEAEKAFLKHVKASRSNRGKTSMLKEVEHHLPVSPDDFDRDKSAFNAQNGYIDLIGGTLNEHSRKKMFTKISNVEFTDKTDCPRWLDFLNEIFEYDQELIDFIQKSVGYSLSGSTREQCMFILFGNGRNGKSVFLDIINDILGSYATNIQPQTLMVKQQTSGANSDIARLKGARLVTTTEPNDGVRLDEGLVKQLTGGDKVTARHLYGNEFEFEPEFKIWMATNHKPIIRGTDDGIWRRMKMIPFKYQIPDHRVDKNLKYKLRKELPAILNWAVEGALKWQKEGLKNPRVVEEANKEYRTEMDVIELFMQECCAIDESYSIQAKVLYQTYKDWAKENNQYEMNNTRFGKEMGQKFGKHKTHGQIKYFGLMINDEYDQKTFSINY